jgi:hypothetical protein
MVLAGLKRPIFAAAALLALLGTLPQGLAVLCVGPDGHLAVELRGVSVAEGAAACRPATPQLCQDHCECHDGCGPCRDSELQFEQHVPRPVPVLQAPERSSGAGAHPGLGLEHSRRAAALDPGGIGWLPRPPSPHLATIVLRV